MRLEHLGPRLADEGLVLGDEAPRPRAVAAVRGADARGELVDERLLRAVRVRDRRRGARAPGAGAAASSP